MHNTIKIKKIFSFNFILISIILFLIVSLASYYIIKSNYYKDFSTENTISNLNNGAYVVEYGSWIYFANGNDNNHLYKMKPDGSQSTKLVSSSVKNLFASNGYIYYIDTDRYNILYRCNTNGNWIKKIVSNACKEFNISDDYIYYINMNDEENLYRCDLNGSNRIVLMNIPKLKTACIVDNTLYTPDSENGNTIQKINLKTGDSHKLNDTISWNCTVNGDWIYFIDLSDSYTLYKMKLNGSHLTKLSKPHCISYNIIDQTIYYQSEVSGEEGLYSCGLEGEDTTLIYKGFFNNLTSTSSSLYFRDFYSPEELQKIDLP